MPPASDTFTLGLIQMRCEPSPAANLDKAVSAVHKAAAAGAQIVCLPELFGSQYFCQRQDPALFDLAEPIPGPSTQRLARPRRETGVVVVGSLFERRAPGVYHNTAVVFDADGAFLGLYRKMHIPDDPLYFEKYYFTPGDNRLPHLRHALRADRRVGLLGSVVPGGGPADGVARRRGAALPDGHRLAPAREGGSRRLAARSVGANPAVPRRRQRRFRGGGQPRRP